MLSHIAVIFCFLRSTEAVVAPFYCRNSPRDCGSYAVESRVPTQTINDSGNFFLAASERSQAFIAPAREKTVSIFNDSIDKAGNYCLSASCSSKKLMMAYYPDWVGTTFPPERIDFTRFDWIDFAFAVPNADFALTWDDPAGPDLLRRLVQSAHAKGQKVKLSVGGWSGSKWVSLLYTQ